MRDEQALALSAGESDLAYRMCRRAIWFYLVLLIFEGALRKWFLPSLATPLLLVRDPIAIYLVYEGFRHRWLDSNYVKVMVVVATVSALATLLVGHHNLFVSLYGWRIYFFHFPVIFVMGQVLTRDDLIRMGRFILYLSIPMTLLVVAQFYSPQTAWVNRGLGGEGGAGFQGAMGYMRPPGTFSFISGYVLYQAVVGCFLLYYLMMNRNLEEKRQLPGWLLPVLVVCYLISIPTSISRTHFFQTLVFLAFWGIAAFRKDNLKVYFLHALIVGLLAVFVLSLWGVADTMLEVFNARLEGASKVEGGVKGTLGDRYLGGLLGAFQNTDIPVLGYGMGLGTNAGARLMGGNMYSFGFNAENEWGRIVGECGLLLGTVLIGIRLFFSLEMWRKAYQCLTLRTDMLPWMLSAGMLLTVPQGQWGIPTNLGFCILLGGFTLVAVKTSGK